MVHFINEFATEISQPLDDDTVPANDYLASQILIEYLRWYLPTQHGTGAQALSATPPLADGANWVMFAGPEDCGETGPGALQRFIQTAPS